MPAGTGADGRSAIKTLTLLPHPSGPWLARVGKRNFAIPAELGKALLPMQGEPLVADRVSTLLKGDAPLVGAVLSWEDAAGPDGKQWHTQRTIWGQMSLVPEPLVRWAAKRIAFLAGGRALAVMGALGFACYCLYMFFIKMEIFTGYASVVMAPKSMAVVLCGLGVFLMTGVWHEMGHAAALSREGYAPGRIGLGFLLVIPVFFAEVTAVGMLARRGRLRVDCAGMVFQLFAGGMLLVLSLGCGFWLPLAGVLQVAGVSSLVAVLWSLLPFVRSDGYWALADYLEVENLDIPWSRTGSTSKTTAWFMIAFRLANICFLVFLGVVIPLRVAGWLEYLGWWPVVVGGWGSAVAKGMFFVGVVVIWLGLGRHGAKLGQASWEDWGALVKKRPS